LSVNDAPADTVAAQTGIVLVGFMGAGKSRVGMALAHVLRVPFTDTDDLIEQQMGPIATIFAQQGEAAFRDAERRVALAVLDKARVAPCVVSLGGGAVTDADVRAALARLAHVAWLTAPLDVLRERVFSDEAERPLAIDERRFAELFARRASLYKQVATATFANDGGRPLDAVVAELASWATGESRPIARG
jgi:shikimate kinase